MAGENLIVSTAYLPPLGYVSALGKAGTIFMDLDETYPKQTCRNHACIYSPNGKQVLSIPVKKPGGNHTKTRDIRISYDTPWQKIHWRSIEAAYNNSPYFIHYWDSFTPFYEKEFDFLADINAGILETLFGLLRISKEVRFADTYVKNPEGFLDLRQQLTAKHAAAACPPYTQTFSEKHGFLSNLSIIDLIFNLGPEAREYLDSMDQNSL